MPERGRRGRLALPGRQEAGGSPRRRASVGWGWRVSTCSRSALVEMWLFLSVMEPLEGFRQMNHSHCRINSLFPPLLYELRKRVCKDLGCPPFLCPGSGLGVRRLRKYLLRLFRFFFLNYEAHPSVRNRAPAPPPRSETAYRGLDGEE